jgi:glycosyltransferase involved in cell wall biosynthesis
MKVLFATQYGALAASSRTRVFQYLPHLHQRGIETAIITVLPDRGIGGAQLLVTQDRWRKLLYYARASVRTLACGLRAWRRAGKCDVLFIQKVIFPAPVRWLLAWRRPAVLYDFDDAIFTSEVRESNWLADWKQRRNRSGLPAMLKLADLALVENEYTAEFAARYCPSVATITGPVDTERYRARPRPEKPVDEVVLGWIGSATTAAYLEMIRQPLARLGRRFGNLRLRLVGADAMNIEGVPVEASAWDLASEVEDLEGFDIGLMPMPDDPWTRGKGGYKLLQYMAMGLPVVTSPVGINRRIVSDGDEGFWARSPEEWEDRLGRLICNPELRREMGRRGRAAVEAEYAVGVSSRRLLALLEGLAESG